MFTTLLCGVICGAMVSAIHWDSKQLAKIIGGIMSIVLGVFLLAAGCALVISVFTNELTVMLARIAPLLLFSTASVLTFLFGWVLEWVLKNVKQRFFSAMV